MKSTDTLPTHFIPWIPLKLDAAENSLYFQDAKCMGVLFSQALGLRNSQCPPTPGQREMQAGRYSSAPTVLTSARGRQGLLAVSAPCATHPPKDSLWVKFSWDYFLPAAPASGPQSEEWWCSAGNPFDVLIFIRCHASISGPQALQKQFQSHKNDPNLVEISVNSGVMNIANLDHHFFQQNWIKEVPRPYY